jgi:uncharacterized membrane protein YraQ (UPF0718 family)
MLAVFLAAYFIPFESARFKGGVLESFYMLQDYARLHVLLCLIPALVIAGAVSVFVSSSSVMSIWGLLPRRWLLILWHQFRVRYWQYVPALFYLSSAESISGRRFGSCVAFLYSGPAINVLAIVMTARILGLQIGIARAVGAVLFSIIIGLIMHVWFRKEEGVTAKAGSRIRWR